MTNDDIWFKASFEKICDRSKNSLTVKNAFLKRFHIWVDVIFWCACRLVHYFHDFADQVGLIASDKNDVVAAIPQMAAEGQELRRHVLVDEQITTLGHAVHTVEDGAPFSPASPGCKLKPALGQGDRLRRVLR